MCTASASFYLFQCCICVPPLSGFIYRFSKCVTLLFPSFHLISVSIYSSLQLSFLLNFPASQLLSDVAALLYAHDITIYKAAASLCVSVRLSVPPFFRHRRLTATKFATHMRIDPGIIRTQKYLTHPTPGGSQREFRGSKIQKSGKCHELPRKSINKINPYPTGGGGGGCGRFSDQ